MQIGNEEEQIEMMNLCHKFNYYNLLIKNKVSSFAKHKATADPQRAMLHKSTVTTRQQTQSVNRMNLSRT